LKVALYVADQNPHRDRTLGITGYTRGLITALQAQGGSALEVIHSASSYVPESGGIVKQRLPFRTDRAAGRLVADHLHPLFCRTDADLWHYPKGYLPLIKPRGRPVVGTVHDVILQHQADHYPRARSRLAYAYWLALMKRSIANFDLILTISEFSASSIRQLCERAGLRCPPIRVTYEGFSVQAAPAAEKRDAVVHLASTEPHKRTATLLKLWGQLQETEPELPQLRLLGTLTPQDRAAAQRLHNVSVCGRLPRAELEAEIAASQGLLLPSEIEGFGLPALEAYALGAPVAYVRNTAVEEVLGAGTPGGFLLDNSDSFRSAVAEVLSMPAAAIVAKRNEVEARFSWERCARKTEDAYRECLGAGRAAN
jgi:glycosyltransferase involved in cell wall biosynthesis